MRAGITGELDVCNPRGTVGRRREAQKWAKKWVMCKDLLAEIVIEDGSRIWDTTRRSAFRPWGGIESLDSRELYCNSSCL